MIVRISGTGQFEFPDNQLARLHQLDDALTQAVHAGDEDAFHKHLHEIIQLVKDSGSPVPDDTVVPSQVIVPPEDVTLDEGQRFFHDEGLLEPVQA